MTSEDPGHGPPWWTAPGEIDHYAFIALGVILLFVLLIFYLYAVFDRFVERRGHSTPLKTTIPTLLVVALAYEIMPPLTHFSILLPLALIATALARDLMLWFSPAQTAEEETATQTQPAESAPAAQDGPRA